MIRNQNATESDETIQRNKTSPNECLNYDTKPYDGEAPVQKLWVVQELYCHYSDLVCYYLFGPIHT